MNLLQGICCIALENAHIKCKEYLRFEFYSAIQILEKNEELQQYISPEVRVR